MQNTPGNFTLVVNILDGATSGIVNKGFLLLFVRDWQAALLYVGLKKKQIETRRIEQKARNPDDEIEGQET